LTRRIIKSKEGIKADIADPAVCAEGILFFYGVRDCQTRGEIGFKAIKKTEIIKEIRVFVLWFGEGKFLEGHIFESVKYDKSSFRKGKGSRGIDRRARTAAQTHSSVMRQDLAGKQEDAQ
jgi:hypothetical protein